MKTVFVSPILASLLASFALPVAAQEIIEFDDHFVSTRTRAEVQAEAATAAAAGQVEPMGEAIEYPTLVSASSTRTRAEVRAEVARAAAAGELNMQGEITVIPPLHVGSTRLAGGGVDRAS
jgi:diphthamide synthase (EF-2-diphthine--ammonia ligase)